MIFTCKNDHYWVRLVRYVKDVSTRICPTCKEECNLGITGNGKLFEKAKDEIRKTMTLAQKGVFIVAYSSDDDRNTRTDEVARKLVFSIEEMKKVSRTIFAKLFFSYETELNKPLSSGEDAERYLPPWYE